MLSGTGRGGQTGVHFVTAPASTQSVGQGNGQPPGIGRLAVSPVLAQSFSRARLITTR